MNRRALISVAGLAAVGVAAPFALDRSGNAQDNTEARLDSLETRVAVLETKVAGNSAPAKSSAKATATASANGLSFTGSGEELVGPFHLDAGSYVVDVSVAGQKYDFADVKLREVGGTADTELLTVFNGAPFSGQLLITVADTGDYRLISSGSDGAKWTITFSPE